MSAFTDSLTDVQFARLARVCREMRQARLEYDKQKECRGSIPAEDAAAQARRAATPEHQP